MPKNNENFNKELEGFLRAQGMDKIATTDASGNPVPDAGAADQFRFHYKNGSQDYGTVTITTHDGKVTVYYNDSVTRDENNRIDTNWTKFLIKLKDWSLRNGQMGFSTKNLDDLGNAMKKRVIQKEEEGLLEGYYGTRHTSYNDKTPRVKMIIKHSKPIEETDQRFRHIERIFLETERGERLLLNTKKPSIGRVYARHLAEGGEYNDDRWKHINEISEDVNKLSGFVRATKSGQFNESVQRIVSEAVGHYNHLKETIQKLQGSRGYHHYFENWQPSIMEQGSDTDYEPMFRSSILDPRIESALPVLAKLNIRTSEISEANEFESWASGIVEGRSPELDKKIDDLIQILSDQDPEPVGADALNIKGKLEDIFDDEQDRDNLFAKLEKIARADPDHDAKPAIISWLEEHSDDKYYGDVLDKLDAATEKSIPTDTVKAPPKKKPAPEAPPMPQADLGIPEPSPQDKKAAMPFMPAPLAEEENIDESFLTRIRKLSGLK